MIRIFYIAIVLGVLGSARGAEKPADAATVFEKRLLPIFRSPNPSSCVQCHLAGVDLKQYLRPSHEATFVALRDQGMIDLDRPERSKILHLIQMGKDETGGAALIHRKTRAAEYAAFAEWIRRSAADPRLRRLPQAEAGAKVGPSRPAEVVRHARTDRMLETFTNTVWAMRFRCMSCHTEGTGENRKLVQEHGQRVALFRAEGPAATLEQMRNGRLIDVDHPERSLLLRKPLNEVKHGGGQKFVVGDQGYRAFRTFVEDYARTVKDGYRDAASLPRWADEPQRFGTDVWLKLTSTPPAWGDRLLQVSVYAWDERTGGWEREPIATSDRVVWGKGRLWQHTLTLLAARGSARAAVWAKGKPALDRGRYLVKVHVDRGGRTGGDWQTGLGPADFVGQVEVTSAWPAGYGKMTTVDAAAVRRPAGQSAVAD
ncbi:MAG: hypothetical protein U0736_24440 [Gemmataceae bacterium]